MRYEDNNSVLIGAVRALILLLRIRWAVIIWGNSKGIFNNKNPHLTFFAFYFYFACPNPGTDTGQVRPILFCFVFDGSANDRTTHRTNERTYKGGNNVKGYSYSYSSSPPLVEVKIHWQAILPTSCILFYRSLAGDSPFVPFSLSQSLYTFNHKTGQLKVWLS